MFLRLSELFFGRLSEVPQKQDEGSADEEWLLVSLRDGENLLEMKSVSSSQSVSRSLGGQSITENTVVCPISGNSVNDPQGGPAPRVQVTDGLIQSKSAPRVRVQSVQADHRLSHRCIQRQNRVFQRISRHTRRPIILQQPSHRGVCH